MHTYVCLCVLGRAITEKYGKKKVTLAWSIAPNSITLVDGKNKKENTFNPWIEFYMPTLMALLWGGLEKQMQGFFRKIFIQ